MSKLSPTQKRELLAEMVELYSQCGYSISEFMGRELSYFNYEAVKIAIAKLKIQLEEQNN